MDHLLSREKRRALYAVANPKVDGISSSLFTEEE
jgi:hypothetical protein